MNKLPKSRNENIIVQNLDNEVLIYDVNTNQAFCLNETSAKVYNHCDGQTSYDELKRKYKFTNDLIFLALDELQKQNLLEKENSYQSPFVGMNRREVIRKVGMASIIALPVISFLVAPIAADAQSGAAAATCAPNTAGCLGSGFNTAAGNGTNCPAACEPFGRRCCSCTIQFAIARPAFNDCFCACQ